MGGKSKPTIGYWYKPLLHLGFCQGPVDAVLELRGGDKPAWQGLQAESGVISIDAKELWGGEKAEGGIQGDFDVMMGEPDQMPSAYLAANLGPDQSAFRGKVTGVFKGGLYGAFNPYPKPLAMKTRRILKGWDNDVCWYPEKAAIVVPGVGDPVTAEGYFQVETGALVFNGLTVYGTVETGFVGTARQIGEFALEFRNTVTGSTFTFAEAYIDEPVAYGPSIGSYTVEVGNAAGAAAVQVVPVCPSGYSVSYIENGEPSPLGDTNPTILCSLAPVGVTAMNAVHIIYDSITHPQMQGEPVSLIDDVNFRAAADRAFSEGFGLCTDYDATSETVEDFQKRILNVLGASLSQSRVDGKYRLTLVRDDYVLEDLPILGDDNILEYSEEASDPLEAVNQVTVEWFDPARKETRAAGPLQSLGAIQAAGGVIAETVQHPEIPYEELALRVGARNLGTKSVGLKRFELTTDRTPYAWRGGQYFRLQAPRRGISDMVCLVGELGAGTRRSGAMRLQAIQDVSRMPMTTYVVPEPGVDTSPTGSPGVPAVQIAFEAPYVELAANLSTIELAALGEDAGFLLAAASRPSAGLNFDLWTATGAEALADRGDGDWSESAVIVEAATESDTEFSLSDGLGLDAVLVGQAALWDGEICRVDAIDASMLTVTLGRGCADTCPRPHAAGMPILFYGGAAASDSREYADGEIVTAKLLTRTSSALLPIALAPSLTVIMASRAARPYPPGALRVTDEFVTAAAYPVTATGELEVTWAHRDRVLQDDQLVDESAESVGPEEGTTYTVRFYLDGVLDEEEAGIVGTVSTPVVLSGDGIVRLEVWAVRDSLESWQAAQAEFSYLTQPSGPRITDAGNSRITDSGNRRITD